MNRIGLRYKDGSDLDYIMSYDVPEEVPLKVIAQLSKVYNELWGAPEDGFQYHQVCRFNFEEWILDTCGVVIVPVDEGDTYDALTGEPW